MHAVYHVIWVKVYVETIDKLRRPIMVYVVIKGTTEVDLLIVCFSANKYYYKKTHIIN